MRMARLPSTSTLRFFSCACQLSSTVYSFARLVQLFSYPIELFRDPMATRVEVDDDDSSPGPLRSYNTAPVHKWTLKTWLKVHRLSYSGIKKDELVVK